MKIILLASFFILDAWAPRSSLVMTVVTWCPSLWLPWGILCAFISQSAMTDPSWPLTVSCTKFHPATFQRYRFLLHLAHHLPSASPTDKQWPLAPPLFRHVSENLRQIHHRWRVSPSGHAPLHPSWSNARDFCSVSCIARAVTRPCEIAWGRKWPPVTSSLTVKPTTLSGESHLRWSNDPSGDWTDCRLSFQRFSSFHWGLRQATSEFQVEENRLWYKRPASGLCWYRDENQPQKRKGSFSRLISI